MQWDICFLRWAFKPKLYGSAEAFIAAATRSAAACLLVDIQLGDLTGIELTRHLSAMGFTFPIIFMTGSDDRLFRKQAIEIGCVAYLSKPIPPERLKAAIAEAIGWNRLGEPAFILSLLTVGARAQGERRWLTNCPWPWAFSSLLWQFVGLYRSLH